MLRLAGVLLLAALQGCCFLCFKVRVDYELQVRDGLKPVPGAKVTFAGVEGLPSQTAVTGEDGRCAFTVKDFRRLLEGHLGPSFSISISHQDYVPVHYIVREADLIKEDEDYHRVESIQLPSVHFRLECARADQSALAIPLKDLLASKDLRSDVLVYPGRRWQYGHRGETGNEIPSGRAKATVLLLTPAFLKEAGSAVGVLHDAAVGRHTVIPVILGPVSDVQRAEIQSAARRPVHSISSYDGRSPVPAEEFAGLIELLATIAREPLR